MLFGEKQGSPCALFSLLKISKNSENTSALKLNLLKALTFYICICVLLSVRNPHILKITIQKFQENKAINLHFYSAKSFILESVLALHCSYLNFSKGLKQVETCYAKRTGVSRIFISST